MTYKLTSDEKIWNVMKDGRERTTEDVCNRLGTNTEHGLERTTEMLGAMVRAGVMKTSTIRLGSEDIRVWRAKK